VLIGAEYTSYGLVIVHEDDRPYEELQIAVMLRALINEHNLTLVVLHSLRHCSTSLKL